MNKKIILLILAIPAGVLVGWFIFNSFKPEPKEVNYKSYNATIKNDSPTPYKFVEQPSKPSNYTVPSTQYNYSVPTSPNYVPNYQPSPPPQINPNNYQYQTQPNPSWNPETTPVNNSYYPPACKPSQFQRC